MRKKRNCKLKIVRFLMLFILAFTIIAPIMALAEDNPMGETSGGYNNGSAARDLHYDSWIRGSSRDVGIRTMTIGGDTTTQDSKEAAKQAYENDNLKDPGILETGIAELIANAGNAISAGLKYFDNVDATMTGIIMGSVKDGGTISLFVFDLTDNNIYGIAGSYIYLVMRNLAAGIIFIASLYKVVKALWNGNSRAGAVFKESLISFTVSITAIYLMPFVVDYVCSARDGLIVLFYKVSDSWFGSDSSGALMNSIEDQYRIQFEKHKSIVNAIIYAAVCFMPIWYLTSYIRIAVTQLILFGTFPLFETTGMLDNKKSTGQWLITFVTNCFVPCIDALMLLLPSAICSFITSGLADDVLRQRFDYSLIKAILVCSMFYAVIPTRNQILGMLGNNWTSNMGAGQGIMAALKKAGNAAKAMAGLGLAAATTAFGLAKAKHHEHQSEQEYRDALNSDANLNTKVNSKSDASNIEGAKKSESFSSKDNVINSKPYNEEEMTVQERAEAPLERDIEGGSASKSGESADDLERSAQQVAMESGRGAEALEAADEAMAEESMSDDGTGAEQPLDINPDEIPGAEGGMESGGGISGEGDLAPDLGGDDGALSDSGIAEGIAAAAGIGAAATAMEGMDEDGARYRADQYTRSKTVDEDGARYRADQYTRSAGDSAHSSPAAKSDGASQDKDGGKFVGVSKLSQNLKEQDTSRSADVQAAHEAASVALGAKGGSVSGGDNSLEDDIKKYSYKDLNPKTGHKAPSYRENRFANGNAPQFDKKAAPIDHTEFNMRRAENLLEMQNLKQESRDLSSRNADLMVANSNYNAQMEHDKSESVRLNNERGELNAKRTELTGKHEELMQQSARLDEDIKNYDPTGEGRKLAKEHDKLVQTRAEYEVAHGEGNDLSNDPTYQNFARMESALKEREAAYNEEKMSTPHGMRLAEQRDKLNAQIKGNQAELDSNRAALDNNDAARVANQANIDKHGSYQAAIQNNQAQISSNLARKQQVDARVNQDIATEKSYADAMAETGRSNKTYESAQDLVRDLKASANLNKVVDYKNYTDKKYDGVLSDAQRIQLQRRAETKQLQAKALNNGLSALKLAGTTAVGGAEFVAAIGSGDAHTLQSAGSMINADRLAAASASSANNDDYDFTVSTKEYNRRGRRNERAVKQMKKDGTYVGTSKLNYPAPSGGGSSGGGSSISPALTTVPPATSGANYKTEMATNVSTPSATAANSGPKPQQPVTKVRGQEPVHEFTASAASAARDNAANQRATKRLDNYNAGQNGGGASSPSPDTSGNDARKRATRDVHGREQGGDYRAKTLDGSTVRTTSDGKALVVEGYVPTADEIKTRVRELRQVEKERTLAGGSGLNNYEFNSSSAKDNAINREALRRMGYGRDYKQSYADGRGKTNYMDYKYDPNSTFVVTGEGNGEWQRYNDQTNKQT